jgi:hypothetical protein
MVPHIVKMASGIAEDICGFAISAIPPGAQQPKF